MRSHGMAVVGIGLCGIAACAAAWFLGRYSPRTLNADATEHPGAARAAARVDALDHDRRESRGAADPNAYAHELVALEEVLRTTVEAVAAPQAYWRDEPRERRAYAEALIAARAQARRMLERRFGDRAQETPAFRALFRPLAQRFPFLESAEQIAIQDAELRFGAALGRRGTAARADAFGELLRALEAELGPAVAFEYGLRTSPLAAQLRASAVTFDEREFRDVYALLVGLDAGTPDPAAFAHARKAVRARLGSARFTALWAARDPRFETLQRVGTRYGLAAETVMSAYAVINDAQDALLEASLQPSGDREADARRLRFLYDDSRARLGDLVGEAAARAILSALSLPQDTASQARMNQTG